MVPQELRTRTAAAFLLRSFFEISLDEKHRPLKGTEMLDVYVALYDTLVDDDEDIRDQGAKTVSFLLAADQLSQSNKEPVVTSLSPPAVKRRFLEFLQKEYHISRAICSRAIKKVTGLHMMHNDPPAKSEITVGEIELRSVASMFSEAEIPQLAVFAEEKQNLYIDSVEEAQTWAVVLLGLDDGARNDSVLAALGAWARDGLEFLVDIVNEKGDGPLGLNSRPEIFILFVRVILMSKGLINHPASQKVLGMDSHLKRLLRRLWEVGKSKGLHSLLIEHIEEALTP